MNIEELMINDIVRFGKELVKVTSLENGGYSRVFIKHQDGMVFPTDPDNLEPARITEEILEKNGWVYNNEDEKFFPKTWVGGGLMLQDADDRGYRIVVTSDYDDEDTNDTPFIIFYVHELRHALMLRRIKKEIVL